jgi:hypothetical protein
MSNLGSAARDSPRTTIHGGFSHVAFDAGIQEEQVAHQESVCPLLPSPRRIRHRRAHGSPNALGVWTPNRWRRNLARRYSSGHALAMAAAGTRPRSGPAATRRRHPQARAALLWEGALVAAVSVSLAALIIATTAVALPGALPGIGPALRLAIPGIRSLSSPCLCRAHVGNNRRPGTRAAPAPRSMAWP